jgi:hypothetical protein
VGLIAEEVQAVYPELVETEDGMAAAVNYSALVAVLVEAVKEQQTVMDDQQKQIATQQARVMLLEDRLALIELLTARAWLMSRTASPAGTCPPLHPPPSAALGQAQDPPTRPSSNSPHMPQKKVPNALI